MLESKPIVKPIGLDDRRITDGDSTQTVTSDVRQRSLDLRW